MFETRDIEGKIVPQNVITLNRGIYVDLSFDEKEFARTVL